MLERRRFQEHHMTELRDHLPWPRVELPYLFTESFDRAAVEVLSKELDQQLTAHQEKAA
jgi:hypothetical protein